MKDNLVVRILVQCSNPHFCLFQIRKAAIEKRRVDDKIELITADKEEADAKIEKLQATIDDTIRNYEDKIDNITDRFMDRIDNITTEKRGMEDQLNELQDEHDKTTSVLKATETELSANKFAYERRIEKLQKDLDNTTEEMDRNVQSLESELNAVHDENDGFRRDKQMLTVQVRSLEADRDEANNTLQKLSEQLSIEREEHEAKIDESTASFSQVIDKLMTERKDLSESLNHTESELADREANIDNLQYEMDAQRKALEEKIMRLNEENDEMNQNILDLSSAKKDAMDKIR